MSLAVIEKCVDLLSSLVQGACVISTDLDEHWKTRKWEALSLPPGASNLIEESVTQARASLSRSVRRERQ